ncbi:MAG: restriction endonuclease subunit S, partial [Aphanocapsa feldmannii 288cV]
TPRIVQPLASLRQFQVFVPPREEQEYITEILSVLDDKIELNHKTNEILDAMARALFKSWFIDFDPVRAKAEARPT